MGKAVRFRFPVWKDKEIYMECSLSDPKRLIQEAFLLCHPGPLSKLFSPLKKEQNGMRRVSVAGSVFVILVSLLSSLGEEEVYWEKGSFVPRTENGPWLLPEDRKVTESLGIAWKPGRASVGRRPLRLCVLASEWASIGHRGREAHGGRWRSGCVRHL